MKKIILTSIIAIASLSVTFIACTKKEKEAPISAPTSQTSTIVQNQIFEDKYDDIIKTVAYGVIDITNNPSFVQKVYDEAFKKFDGDDNVLLKTLKVELDRQGMSLASEMQKSLHNHNKDELIQFIDEAINGFRYFDDTVYPQIFIPFIENWNSNSGNPTVCLNFEDEPILDGISLSENIIIENSIDENFAINNNVFVISVNETVDNLGNVPIAGPIGGSGPLQRIAPSDIYLKVDQVNISDKKEGWGNGRADLVQYTYIYSGSTLYSAYGGGNVFCKLANTDLNSWFTVGHYPYNKMSDYDGDAGNYWTAAKWRAFTDNAVLYTIFYEEDVRRKFVKEDWLIPGIKKKEYISKEEKYGIYQSNHTLFNVSKNTPSTQDYNLSGGKFRVIGHKCD